MATITKESIAEAAKLSNMSVNDYIDKLPDNYLQEAAKLSNIDIATYKTKLKEVWGDNAKKKEPTAPVGNGSGNSSSGNSNALSQKGNKPIIGTIQAQSNKSPYINIGINKSNASTQKEVKFVENKQKPIIGTKDAQQQKSIVSVDIPIKPLPTQEERDKALDKAKAEIELVKITNNFGNKKEDGTDDVAKNITDYYDTSIRQTAVNDLSKPDQLILQLSESVKAIKNEQELIGQQYNSGKISENTYNTLNKNLEKNRTELELKTTGLISERNRDIDNEIKALKQVLLKGERPFDMGKDIDWKKDGGFTEFQNNPNTSPKKLSEDDKAGIKKQITILEKQKGNISENLKLQDEEVNNLQGALQESQKQGLIPKGATLEQALKIQYARNDQMLKMLKEQSVKEGNPFVSSTSGMWDNAKEFVGDMLGHETLSKYNPETKQMEYQKFKSGYENTPRQYLINDKTANKIYKLQEQQKALSSIIELDRYGNYKKDSGLENFTKQFIQSLATTQKGKILTQSEIASATQQALNNAGIHEIQDVTGKVLNDNKHNISDMLGTTAAFMVQFSLTPNVIGKVLSLGKLGMRYNAIRKVAENIEKGIKFTEKSRLGKLFGKMVETGVEYKGKGLLNAQLEEEADFGSGAFGVLGEKLLTKMFPFGAGRWASVIGRGWGELGEETGQQIWQTYKNNGYHIDETIKDLKQQFPEMKDVQMFVFGTALMGMGFGVFSKSTGKDTNLSEDFEKWRENQIEKLKKEGKITTEELNQVNEVLREMADENRNAINNELKDGVDITEEEKDDLIKGAKEVKEQKGNDGNNITTIVDEQGNTMTIKDGKLYLLEEEDSNTENYTISDDGTVMHGVRVIDNPNGLTEIELIKQDIESRKQQELIKANESGADTKDIEQRYNTELDNLEKNSIGSVQEQASTQTDSNSNKSDLQEQASTTPKDTQEITYTYNGGTYIEDNNGNITKEDNSLVPIDQQQEIKANGEKVINVQAPEITVETEDTAGKQNSTATQQSDVSTTNIPQNSDIETKKADIEKRRQEELKQVKSLEQTPEQLIRNTKIAEQRLRDAEEIFSFGNTYSDALDNIMLKQKKLNEILRKREKEETKNRDFHQWEKEELEKQPEYQENKRLDKIIALINEVYTEGKSENFNNSTKEAVDYEQNELNNVSSKKYRNTEEIRKINAKYDAELNALEGAKPAETTPISDKKADIERRRQEELESVSKVINQDDKKILEDNINKRFDLELQKINKENETTSTQPTDTGKKQNDGKGVQESQPNNNGVGTGNVQPTQTQTEQQRERKVIQADIKAVNNAIAELEGKKGVIAKANLEKQKAKLAELNKELADTEESNTTKNTTTTHPTKSSTKKETPKNNLQHSLNFDNLDEKLAQDEAEHRHAESKLTTEDNIEQEPNIKDIESKSEIELNTTIEQADKTLNRANVFITPFSELSVDADRFQPREKQSSKDVEVAVDELLKEYSGEQKETLKSKIIKIINETTGSLESIKRVVNNFDSNKLDPLKTWKDPKDGKTYVANHSRLAGHKILSILPDTDERVIKAKESGFEKGYILTHPTNYKTEQEFVENAQNSNDEATRNTILESANRIRKWVGLTKKQIKEKAESIFRKDANFLINLASLNINGKAINLLKSVEKSTDKTSQKEAEKIADWIGEVRKQNSNITNQHENELFDFLMDKDNSKRIRDKAEFLSKVASITNDIHFNPDNPLNIARYKYKSEGEKQYDKEVEERKDKISELQQKINDINDRFKNPNNPNYVSTDHKDYDSIKAQADKVIADTNVQLKAEQKALQELYQQKGKYTNAGSNQSALFQKGESNTETTPEQKKEAKFVIKFLSDKFKGLFVSDQKVFDDKIKSLGINSSSLVFMAKNSHKTKQLAIINKTNPAPNNYNTWVRSEEDILTAEEAFKTAFEDGEMYPDFTVDDMQEALDNGEVTVYSSYPIKDGVFVTPSFMNAKSYAGSGKIYSKKVKLDAIAWIDEGEGQMAKVQFLKDKNGTIFGLYDPTENKIYLNERNLNPKTVWHEATHFQQAMIKAMAKNGNKEAKKILAQFDKLLKPFVEQLLLGRTTVTIDGQRIPLQADVYKKGANEKTKAYKERMQDELWAFLQQEENHKLWQKNDTPFKRAVNKFKEAVTNLFKSILDIPKHKDISNMTLSELVGHTAKQLQDGRLDSVVKGEKGEVRMMTMPDGTKRQVKVLPEVTNGFYSPIEKKLLDEKATNLSATKWLERLGKGDEMTFTGLKDFLESKKPNEQVKKSELQDFMRDNRIEVVEVVKGGDASEAEIDAFLEDEVGEGYTREEAREYLSNDETNEQTKYHQYQLDGARENYKEVLVTMPKKYSEKERSDAEDRGIMLPANNEKNVFSSSHFDEPNILVHLRMNTRTDSEGNKVLFLEEVQSDWGQTGKKDGFKTSENVWDTQLGKDAVAAIKDMDNLGFDSWQQAATAISKSKDPLNDFDIIYKHKDLILKWRDAVNQERKTSIAPFVTDTNAWTKLGLKVALKEAVAQGADKIAWTTGEQQNERYDLSKQVDDVWVSQKDEWWSQQDRNYIKGKDVEITLKGGGVNKFSVNENGEIVSGDFKGQELEAVIGKEMAEKILSATEETNFGEQDLRVGGSGMKGFYGSPTENKLGIVGNVAKKLFGQEPKTIDVFQSDKLASGWSVTTKDINGNVQTNMFDSKSKGLAWLSKQEELEVLSEDAEGKNYTTQHSITITPEMRETVQEGQPLFMADTNGIYFSISNSNTNFIKDEKTKYYTTSEGKEIPYNVYTPNGNNSSANLLQRQKSTEQTNDFALVERQFTEYNQLDFTAGTKIKSTDDVAWLFRSLEDEAVEHSFVTYIMPNGSYVVQHLGTGSITGTVVDGRLIVGNAIKMSAKSIVFVHNHPSGQLKASNQDMNVYSNLKKGFEGTGIDIQDGVIINLKSGKYVTFNGNSDAVNNITEQNQDQHKVQVLSFSKQVFAENYNPEKISNSNDVAKLLSTKKFGVSDKTEMLILNNSNEIIGKFVLPENNQYSKILELLTQYGGVNAIIYGNKIDESIINRYNYKLKSVGFQIVDAIEVKSNNYQSMADNGLLREISSKYNDMSENEKQDIKEDIKLGLKLGNTVEDIRKMYADTEDIKISEKDFDILLDEAQKEFETEKSGKTTKIDDDTEKDNDIQDTPKENKKDNRKKTYEWHRVHEGKFPKELIENLEKYDLDHEVENQELAEKRALAIIDNFGIENALKAVEKGYITGAEKAVVFSKAIEAIQAEIQLEIDPEIREKLAEDLGDIIRKTGDEMRDAGRFSAMWARIYKNSPLGYNAEYYINKYKESNNGEISKEMEDKFRELEETIKEQNAKIIELEKKQEEEINKQIIESIVNNPPNKKDSKDKKSIKEKTKQLADKFRKFKTKPFTLKDADGNDIIIKQNSIVNYNDIIEAGAKIIEEAGRLGESIEMAIRKAREYVVSELEKQDWYKKLPQRDKDAVNTQLLEHFSIENTIESEYKISKGLLYELTKAGIERKGKDNYTIDDLVDDVYDIYKEQYPDLDKRQIRDDISNYGKTIDLSEEEIDVKLRNLRRDGKMLSAYEDLLNGNLPKRSGLQRDKLTPSQREMQKKINDELRKIPKSAEQLKNAWKSALDAIKRKYQNQIEDLEKQIAKRERIVKILNRTELDDKANNLKARVEELKAELDELVGKKEMSEESKLRLVESNLKKSIEKTQDKLDYININGVEPKTPKNKSVTSSKIEALKEELKLKKEQLKLIREEKGLVEKKRLEMAKKRVAKQIDDLKERIANGDFSKKKRKPLPYDDELNELKREKLKAQKEFELALYQNELANRGKFEIAKDALFEALNIPKGMLATLDMSAPLRQGSMLMFSNPIIFAKSFLKMHGFAFNSSKFENAQLDIENHKDYVLMHESGLGLTSPDARLMAREELFMQRLPKMIPIFSQLHSGSERAYTGFLNKLRVNVFLSGVEKLKEAGLSFESNSKAFKDLAKYVNYATGRGDTTTSEGLNKVLNTVFFSPKMITSRIQMFMLAINPNTTPQVRTMAIKSLLSFATYIASVGALSMAVVGKTMLGSDDDDENFKNFTNPIHTDFAKIRKGDYVYDVTAGYAPLIRTIARMGVMAKISASGKKTELNGKGFRGETGISELGNFFENKLSPLARVVYSMPFLTNKNPNSNKFKETWRDTPPDELIKDIAKSLFIPISVGDIYQNLTDEEIKWYQATTNITLGMYGVGINKYSNKPTPSKQNKMGGGNGFGGK